MKTETEFKIEIQDITEVMEVIKEAIADMECRNIFQWDEVYPDHGTLLNDINTGTLFGIRKNEQLAGIVALNTEQPHEYSGIEWQFDHDSAMVIHRLCVRPKFQGLGIAKQLLDICEQLAIKNNFRSIRLDAFYANVPALNLYDGFGYQQRGTVKFRKGDFYCYEKKI